MFIKDINFNTYLWNFIDTYEFDLIPKLRENVIWSSAIVAISNLNGHCTNC